MSMYPRTGERYTVPPSQRQAQQFGSWFSEQAASRGMNQGEIARHVGVTRQAVSRWVLGKERPRPETCVKIARAFDMSPQDVLARAGHVAPVDDARQALIELVRYLPEERLVEAARYLRFLIGEERKS